MKKFTSKMSEILEKKKGFQSYKSQQNNIFLINKV